MDELSELFKLVAEENKKKREEKELLESRQVAINLDQTVNSLKNPFVNIKPKKKSSIKESSEVNDIISKIGNPFEYKKTKTKIEDEKKPKNIITEDSEVVNEDTLIERSLGLLSEPSDVKQQSDPLTPLDQKFVTLDEFQKHYKLFIERVQQQLSTLGGGGETNLAYMDMPLKYITSSSYTITPQDYYIGVNYAGRVNITLPTPRKNGKVYIVKDERGEASKGNNRHIYIYPSGSDLIDGEEFVVLAYDFGSLTFVYRNGWRVV